MTADATVPAAPAAPAAAAEPELIVTDQAGVRCIALNRPASKNGLTVELNKSIIDALAAAATDGSVRAVLLTGRGGAFCSGLDLKAALGLVQSLAPGTDPAKANEERMRAYFHGLIRAIRDLDKPVIAFLDGAAAGFGCDLALACDLRIGTGRAAFGEIFVKRGLMPDGGGTYFLPRLIGVGRALDMMFLGDMVGATEAQRIGLLSRIVADEAEAFALAQRIAEGPPLVLREIKRAVYGSLSTDLDSALEAEVAGQIKLLQSADFVEGVSAFLSKRPPQFTGK